MACVCRNKKGHIKGKPHGKKGKCAKGLKKTCGKRRARRR